MGDDEAGRITLKWDQAICCSDETRGLRFVHIGNEQGEFLLEVHKSFDPSKEGYCGFFLERLPSDTTPESWHVDYVDLVPTVQECMLALEGIAKEKGLIDQ